MPEDARRPSAQAHVLPGLRTDALEKRIYLYTIARVSGNPIFVPISVAEFKSLVTAELLAGELSSKQLLQLIREMREMTVDNLRALEEYIATYIADSTKQKKHCDALRQGGTTTTPKPPPPPAAGTFTLAPSLTKVTNTHVPELKIDGDGMTAHIDHCCDGGGWKIDYSWQVPQTITPGKSYQITLHIKMLSVTPDQPLGRPDDVSKTFTMPLAASQKDSADIPITIGFVSSAVVYHYRK